MTVSQCYVTMWMSKHCWEEICQIWLSGVTQTAFFKQLLTINWKKEHYISHVLLHILLKRDDAIQAIRPSTLINC